MGVRRSARAQDEWSRDPHAVARARGWSRRADNESRLKPAEDGDPTGWYEDPHAWCVHGAQAAGLNMGKPTEGAAMATDRHVRSGSLPGPASL